MTQTHPPGHPPGHPLDRPIWSALTSRQAALSDGDALARRFDVSVSPLAAPADLSSEAAAYLADLIPAGDDISMLEPAPPPAPEGLEARVAGLCVQMVATAFTAGGGAPDIEPLGDADAADMLALASLTKPGPFRARTHMLGRFLGVRHEGRLVAMAGERLHVEGFHEISAVCTHLDFRGRGYGAALMRAVGDRILSEGDGAFLHVYAHNETALALYRQLGFRAVRELNHVIWAKT